MFRAAVVIVIAATIVGALMPGQVSQADSASNESAILEASAPASSSDWASASREPSQTNGSGSVRLKRQPDGHFYAKAKVNGATIDFMVDTGASGVALTLSDARRAGIDFDKSEFGVVGQGASGEVMGQFVLIDSVKLGHERASDVPGIVMEGGSQSLLGQSFLEKFGSVEIRNDTMTLR